MNKKNCFVIMPFGGNFDGYYNDIYKPAIIESGLIPRRADDIYASSPIINDIWNYVCSSDIILADLTDKNPNVMYELGLAHAISKPTILISKNLSDVPFDLKSMRILLFDTNKSGWEKQLKEDIINFIKTTLKAPLESVLPTFIKVKPNEQQIVTEFQKDIIEIKQALSLIKAKDKFDTTIKKSELNQLDSDELKEAITKSNKLYFKNGNDLISIKNYLMDEYKINLDLSESILNKAIKIGPKD